MKSNVWRKKKKNKHLKDIQRKQKWNILIQKKCFLGIKTEEKFKHIRYQGMLFPWTLFKEKVQEKTSANERITGKSQYTGSELWI